MSDLDTQGLCSPHDGLADHLQWHVLAIEIWLLDLSGFINMLGSHGSCDLVAYVLVAWLQHCFIQEVGSRGGFHNEVEGIVLVLGDGEMHSSFESLVVIGISSLQAFFMDIHHGTSLMSTLKDNSISSTFRACIHSCLDKGVKGWLVARSSICSFCIAHSTFILALCFHLGLIQPSTFSFFMCKCGHRLNALNSLPIWSSTNSHTWCHPQCHVCLHLKEWACYMERTMVLLYVRSFVTSQFLHDPKRVKFSLSMWWLLIGRKKQWFQMSSINQQVQLWNLMPLLKFANIKGFMKGTILFWWSWRCMMLLGVIWIVSLRRVLVFSMIDNWEVIYPCFFAFNSLNNVLVLFF